MKNIILICITIFILAGCAPKDRLGDFLEEHKTRDSYFLYPSTLRMVNLENNQEFNDMIKDLERGRYTTYPKSDAFKTQIRELQKALINDGYEEVLEIKNKEIQARVLLMERKTPILFATIYDKENVHLLEIKGLINPVKIPDLMQSFNDEQFLNIFKLGNRGNQNHNHNNPHSEHTENQQPQ